LPPYSAAQLALLEPGAEPVLVRAERRFPDTRTFLYAEDRVLEDPRDAMRVTRMVAEIVERSPRYYAITDAKRDIANDVAQYGPPGNHEPNPWLVAHKDAEGRVALAIAPVTQEARDAYERGERALKEGRADEATTAFRSAVERSPHVPALRLALARSLQTTAPSEAELAYRELLALDPTLSTAHVGLSELLVARGEPAAARVSLAHALAYHPRSREALALAAKLAASQPERVPPFAIFLDVDPAGAVRIGAPPTTAARMYAGCRAVMRYEPELRELLFGAAPDEPYFLSATEEMLCIESAIGAYVAERAASQDEGRAAPPDEQTHRMMGIAHNEGLLGYVMFEILGKYRPEHARTAPSGVHRAMYLYVAKHVLGEAPDPERELYYALVTAPR
jgi:tetratricopeptide (TPR) repeat protein